MAFVRYADRSAVVCFCPTAPYYLAGSAASAIDLDFSTASLLEVFKVDFSSNSTELPLAGNPITAGERFHSVAWGKTGSDTKLHPLGLVAGGLEDGSVTLWDPNRIIQGSDATRCTVAKLKKHSSPVRALDFNPNLVQYLATGSTEPELFMWDLTRPSIPVAMTSAKLPEVPGGTESEFTCTKWNEKVHQILASCTTSGKTIVQDMRRAKPVATLHDMSSMRRCSVLEWSPERPTQVLVASENDQTPTVQVWDLRNSASPLSELVGHSKGILSMSWSPHDPRLLLTCAKDSKTYCWDVSTSSIVAELPPLGAWHLHLQWSPITPGLFSVSAFDGKIGLCSFTSMKGVVSDGYTLVEQPLSVVPKWMERPGGLSFGFGGKLAHVNMSEKVTQNSATGAPMKIKESVIRLKQLSLETESVPQSDVFDAVLRTGDRVKISEYCKTRQGSVTGEEKETWQMLGLMFSNDAKHELLTHLGFDPADLPRPEAAVMNGDEPEKHPILETGPQDSGVNAAMDFFENLADEDVTSPKAEPVAPEVLPKKQEMTAGVNEDEIQKALLVRNYEAAVESCLKAGRDADALLIAHVAGTSLFERVTKRYMEQKPKPFMSLLSAVAANDFNKLIQSRSVAQWRETLAMLVAYVDDSETWGSLCDALGLCLYQSGSIHAASLCFICSGNLEKAVTVWSAQGAENLTRMHEIIQKAFVLGAAVPQNMSSESLCTIVHNYAQILASQGSVQTALDYLDMVPGEPSENLQILRDRIYGSGMVVEPETSWQSAQTHTATPAPVATPAYPTEYHQYQQTTAQNYQEGNSNIYGPPMDGAYDPGYQTQQPPAQPYVPGYQMQQQQQPPPSQHYSNPPPSNFQPTMSSHAQAPSLFTPQVPVPSAPGGAGMGAPPQHPSSFQPTPAPPSFQPTPAPAPFQPTPAPPSVMQQHQSSIPTAPPVQQPFVPDAPPVQQPFMPTGTSTPSRPPQVFNPVGSQPGVPPTGSPTQPMSPPSEPTPPHDITALNADVSNVPAQFKPIVTHLRGLFTKFEAANVAPSQKRIVSDASKRTGLLFWDLNRGAIKSAVAEKVMQYAQALATGDTPTATKVLTDLTETAWDESSSHWLSSFKRLIRLAQTIK